MKTPKPQPRTLKLTVAWGGHAKGAELEVLQKGIEMAPHRVDPVRAEQLISSGRAIETTPSPAKASGTGPAAAADASNQVPPASGGEAMPEGAPPGKSESAGASPALAASAVGAPSGRRRGRTKKARG